MASNHAQHFRFRDKAEKLRCFEAPKTCNSGTDALGDSRLLAATHDTPVCAKSIPEWDDESSACALKERTILKRSGGKSQGNAAALPLTAD